MELVVELQYCFGEMFWDVRVIKGLSIGVGVGVGVGVDVDVDVGLDLSNFSCYSNFPLAS